ncbi:MAG: DUF2095 family protein [Candidatus Thorarchaeota archaeon]|jgi:hypothetical protein
MKQDDEFGDAFPALKEELESGRTQEHRIDGVRTMSEEPKEEPTERTFVPDVVDYIRRCDTVTQAVEIIDYMVNRGELSKKEAREIKTQLKSDGIRSFGAKKEKDHYLHHGTE